MTVWGLERVEKATFVFVFLGKDDFLLRMLYHLKFKFTGIKNIQFVILGNEESHQVIQIMRFLVPRNDNILNKYSSIFKAKLVL